MWKVSIKKDTIMFMNTSDIRSAYLDFFKENEHTHVKSSSLVPDNDPTLMFTNAGMVQFKDVFIGKKTLPFKRATTSQKCLRAGGKHNDLENVGYTARHHTFFEMLGNFSFGDYFKEKAIYFAFEFVLKTLCLPKEKLLVTVHSSDEEAASLWKKIAGFSDDKIIRIPTNDNFWSMGDTGPCGPCTEIFYDHGEKIPGGPPGSEDSEGDRFIEIWNLVFMQFETLSDGSRINLPSPSIDTGMGLERISAVMQGVHSNYEIDLFKTIIEDIKHITSCDNPKYSHHNNVIADHIRAISFMIQDGIIPSNEGRGYVLRRIIRRALRHGYAMGVKDPFLYKLVKSVSKSMGDHYKELYHFENTTSEILKSEEENFMKTIDNGMRLLKDEISKFKSTKNNTSNFPADIAYKLYDTYGFPIDLTQDILKAENKKVDEKEFEEISNAKKEMSKNAWVGTGDKFTEKVWYDVKEKLPSDTEFIRHTFSLESKILAIIMDDEIVQTISKDSLGYVVLDKTPFYAESGGQAGDNGFIFSKDKSKLIADVLDTKTISGVYAHKIKVKTDSLSVGETVFVELDIEKRTSCSRNHTATHILQKALQSVLGERVAQKGSSVTYDKLRFDFIHNTAITHEQIDEVESIVRDTINKSLNVSSKTMPLEDAIKSGAMALFGEKYPENVRVISIGDNFSKELCGGEHVSNTSEIIDFKILSVSSIGSGIKRIEAVTGNFVRQHLESEILIAKDKVDLLKTTIKSLEKEISDLKSKLASNNFDLQTCDIGNIKFLKGTLLNADNKTLLSLIDKEKQYQDDRIVFLLNKNTDKKKISVCVFVSESLTHKITAIDLLNFVKESAGINIKFGGRPDLVQAGGIDESFSEILTSHAEKYILSKAV